MRAAVGLLLLAALSGADVPVRVVLPGNTSVKNSVSWWGPMLLTTRDNKILLFGTSKNAVSTNQTRAMLTSADGGETWSGPTWQPYSGQVVYSAQTGAIIQTIDFPPPPHTEQGHGGTGRPAAMRRT